MPTKFILLNGPPESGKSTIAREFCRYIKTDLDKTAIQDEFAAPLKHFIAVALGERYQEMNKSRARPELNGHSARQFMIRLSEDHVRAIYGRDIFARWLVHRHLKYATSKPDFVVIDDLGFPEEADALPGAYVVRITRQGKNFSDDSRDFILNSNPDRYFHIDNSYNLGKMWQAVRVIVKRIGEDE